MCTTILARYTVCPQPVHPLIALMISGTIRSIALDPSVHTMCAEGMDLAELLAYNARLMCGRRRRDVLIPRCG